MQSSEDICAFRILELKCPSLERRVRSKQVSSFACTPARTGTNTELTKQPPTTNLIAFSSTQNIQTSNTIPSHISLSSRSFESKSASCPPNHHDPNQNPCVRSTFFKRCRKPNFRIPDKHVSYVCSGEGSRVIHFLSSLYSSGEVK